MDDSAMQNVPNPPDLVRSRSYSDLSMLDPAFDDLMRKAVEKSSYVKRFKPFTRRLVLQSFTRSLLFCIAFAIMRDLSHDKRENQEGEHQQQPSQRPFLLEYLPFAIGGCAGFAFADFGNAVFLWYSTRKMRGQWFLSAANMRDGMWVSVGWFESDCLLLNTGLYLTTTVLSTITTVLVVGIVEFYVPGFFLSLWWHVVHVLWHHYILHVPARLELIFVILPCAGLVVADFVTVWYCHRAILQFRQICRVDWHDDFDFDWSIIVDRVYYSALDLVNWSVIWVG
ncbi:uncharacterized protein LOC129602187, partial [Paramacrobiotus metropolitanus]|uniref:uncharacterized protein LOC129602187 n=1 Tax=Paramacrobiotus metropolitanus TaxID=2943436 RepID=UPI00244641F4